ncbi:KIF28 protein, partial [Polyodon spathula]|nr:KIF28 protein [Polyodon spathula]
MDFQIQISQCLGVKWIKEQSRGIQISLLYSMHVTIQHVTMDFLNYLKTHPIILELFGLQELCERLLHLELECDKLREENRVLKTENVELRGDMEEEARQGAIPDNTSISQIFSNDRLSGRSAFSSFDAEFAKALKRFYFGMNGVKGKLNHLKDLCPEDEYNIRSLQYFVDERIKLIKEFGGDLEGCVGKMKSDVEKIIQKKKKIHLALSAK